MAGLNHKQWSRRFLASLASIWSQVLRAAVTGVASLSLLACGGSSGVDGELRAHIESVKARPGGKIEPLPVLEVYEGFQYAAYNMHDPFKPTAAIRAVEAASKKASGKQPDLNRERGLLESYPLDSLRLVGSMQGPTGKWALVRNRENEVFRVGKGEYLGQNHGKIIHIAENKVELLELIPDGLGGWEERPTVLEVSE